MKRFVLLFAIAVMIACCKPKSVPLQQELICTELFSDSVVGGIEAKAAAERDALWPHQRDMQLPIVVKFLNGTSFQKSKVKQYAALWDSASVLGWNGRRKIHIIFVPDTYPPQAYTDIRVRFIQGGSASCVGADCRNFGRDQATTVFGWVDENHSEEQIKQVVLHEFGHVLGLIHEHQNPTANIPWDRPRVYEYYRLTQNPPWTTEMVDRNIFRLYDASRTNYTQFDPLSIMCYAIPPSITTGGYSTPWNSNLSATDLKFIKDIYPYYPCIVNETCCFDRRGRRIPCP